MASAEADRICINSRNQTESGKDGPYQKDKNNQEVGAHLQTCTDPLNPDLLNRGYIRVQIIYRSHDDVKSEMPPNLGIIQNDIP